MLKPAVLYRDEWYSLQAILKMSAVDDLTAEYFRGYVPDSYETASDRILYVAPSVPGYHPPLLQIAPHPLENDPLALTFARALGALSKGAAEPFDNVAVTAVCKISKAKAPMDAQLLLAQHQLAVQTLRYELYSLQPKLVVFACSGSFSAVIRETILATRGSSLDLERKGEGNAAVLFRKRGMAGEPAVLIVQPPSAFPQSVQPDWLALAASLLKEQRNPASGSI